MRAIVRAFLVVVAVAIIAAAADFMGFAGRASRTASDDPQAGEADAVAALTGGSDARITEGVRLADELRLPLLISGVHIDTTTADIANIVGASEAAIACCVTLGRAASTTEGNGAEVADWARRYEFQRLIVVTSDYHMDRAMLELKRAMPEGEFIPHAVASLKVPANRWYTDLSTARRLIGEWIKYRVAALRAGDGPSGAVAQTPPRSANQ